MENVDGSLVPIPVRILNVVVDGDRPNLDQDFDDDVLVRRFLLCDAMTGREGDEDAYFNPGHQPIVFRWAAHIALQVKVRPDTEAQIFVPVLSIAYAEKRTSSLQEGDETTVSFKAEYTMGTTAFWVWAGILLVLALVCICGFSGFKLYVLAARFPGIPAPYVGETAKALFTPRPVVQALVVFTAAFIVLFFFHYILVMYWLIMFKGQGVPHLLLPSGINGNQYAPHDIFLVILVLLGTISVSLGLIKQLNLFIFVVDWERRSPHRSAADGEGVKHAVGSTLNTSGVSALGTSAQTIGAPSESALLVPPPTFGDEANAPDSGISAWRSIFVCNELNERLSSTRTRWHVTWMAMTVLLEGLGWKNVARWYPGTSTGDEYEAAQFNPFLQFAFSASVWMSMIVAQLLFQWVSSIKFGHDLLDFVDACSIANISVVFMDEPFHGFYIHGKAPSRRGEWSHTELAKALHDEQRGVGFHRGLAPGGCPTFEFFLPPDLAVHVPTTPPRAVHFRQELTRVFADVKSSRLTVASRPDKKETLEDIVDMSKHRCRLQSLIDTMVDHVNRNATQVVQKRSRSDRLWGAPPPGGVVALRQPVFYEDETELAWSACLACGSELRFLGLGIPIGFELHLILFEFILFSLGWRIGSIYLGVGLTFALNHSVLGLYSFAGRRALAQSTIIKEKFLI